MSNDTTVNNPIHAITVKNMIAAGACGDNINTALRTIKKNIAQSGGGTISLEKMIDYINKMSGGKKYKTKKYQKKRHNNPRKKCHIKRKTKGRKIRSRKTKNRKH